MALRSLMLKGLIKNLRLIFMYRYALMYSLYNWNSYLLMNYYSLHRRLGKNLLYNQNIYKKKKIIFNPFRWLMHMLKWNFKIFIFKLNYWIILFYFIIFYFNILYYIITFIWFIINFNACSALFNYSFSFFFDWKYYFAISY